MALSQQYRPAQGLLRLTPKQEAALSTYLALATHFTSSNPGQARLEILARGGRVFIGLRLPWGEMPIVGRTQAFRPAVEDIDARLNLLCQFTAPHQVQLFVLIEGGRIADYEMGLGRELKPV
jgi:hypothetical protein